MVLLVGGRGPGGSRSRGGGRGGSRGRNHGCVLRYLRYGAPQPHHRHNRGHGGSAGSRGRGSRGRAVAPLASFLHVVEAGEAKFGGHFLRPGRFQGGGRRPR